MGEPMFNMVKMFKDMRKSGFSEEQSSAVLGAIEAHASANLATKGDLALVRQDLAEVKAELKSDLSEAKTELTKTIYTVVVAGIALNVTITGIMLRVMLGN